jgi:hypothetical protein
MELDVLSFYRENLKLEAAVSDIIAEDIYRRLLIHHMDQMNPYTSYVFRYGILFWAVVDIVQDTPSTFSLCLPRYLKSLTPLTLFTPEILQTGLADVFANLLADQFLWSDQYQGHVLPRWMESDNKRMTRFCHFLVQLVYEGCPVSFLIQNVIGLYRPSYLALYCVSVFTNELSQRFDASSVCQVVSKVFSETWLWKCFPDDESKFDFIYYENFLDVFPFLGYRIGLEVSYSCLPNWKSPILSYYLALQPSIVNLRLTKVVMKSVLQQMYTILQRSKDRNQKSKEEIVPVFVISKEACDEIGFLWKSLKEPLKKSLGFCEESQILALDLLLKEWQRRRFEPKGFCYMVVSLMCNCEVYEELMVARWFTKSELAKELRESLIVELNCLVLSNINCEDFLQGL